ncbi:MAG TPA: LytR C-terminal domain-containing protein [Candidatus Kapabacteria bacterium]
MPIGIFDRLAVTARRLKRRKELALQFLVWSFVSMVVLIVLLLLWQFVMSALVNHPVSGELNKTDLLVRKGERIQLNVWNGSGRMRLAQKFTDYLRARKFDVVEMENYRDTDVARTYIIDRVGDSLSSVKIAYALGVNDSLIRREIDTEEYVKADLIIGRDYEQLNPMK